jgi:tRNA(Ile)-lysidine synthase
MQLTSIDDAARDLVIPPNGRRAKIVLAVSGGCDSMVLMHAVARALGDAHASRVSVATFDHGTGPHSAEAADLVVSESAKLGLDCHVGRAKLENGTEAVWRQARWQFLRSIARDGAVATAHTRDDQLETVVMRALRGAGARGLAGIDVRTVSIVRPFLGLDRENIRAYANAREISFVEDPSNASRAYLRNRIRLDLLPAIVRVRPRFGDEMLAVSRRASEWRASVDEISDRFVSGVAEDGGLRVARGELATYDSAALCVLWPAIAARAGVTLDRRGTQRLAQFTTSGAPGARIQLSGGAQVYRHRDFFLIRRAARVPVSDRALPLRGIVEFGEWRFSPLTGNSDSPTNDLSAPETVYGRSRVQAHDVWAADLPGDLDLFVRAWQPADRMRVKAEGAARRVKRFFGDAQVPGPSRSGWPVVLADNEIVWIPGVRRADAAPERSGRPVVRYACERVRGGASLS